MTKYPNLLRTIQVAGVHLPNRMVMGAMHTRLETMDQPYQRLAAFYVARAKGEIGLILTGGYAPCPEGVMDAGGLVLNKSEQLDEHRLITSAVNNSGGRIVLQILHAGRYAKVPTCVAPSLGKARINVYPPRSLTTQEVWQTIQDFAHTAALAEAAGYAGVEIMGSEGYLINEFASALTNQRDDEFGGDVDRRMRFPLEIVKAVRSRVRKEFMIIYRISAIDLMDGGMTSEEVCDLARHVEASGADLINTGIGWHESGVPTMAAPVPRAAWIDAVRHIKRAVTIPVMASNRINTPDVAEDIIASGAADLVSMARPLLADPDFAKKTRQSRADEINTCIACNQACLDRIFTDRVATCLVNPRAGREIEFNDQKTDAPKKFAVIGGGPAGMAFAVNAAHRGHVVTLFESSTELGGQLNMAKKVPGKSEFHEMLRYFSVALDRAGVRVHLSTRLSAAVIAARIESGEFDEVIVATGVLPRRPEIKGLKHPKVVTYLDVLADDAPVGKKVAIIGAGGIGFDVAEYLVGDPKESLDPRTFMDTWGVDTHINSPGGLKSPAKQNFERTIHMFQRKPETLGKNLGKSTGWILKAKLRRAGVAMTAGVSYDAIDDQGLHITVNGDHQVVNVDTVVLCSGQVSNRTLYDELIGHGIPTRIIGGADVASELDALRAIEQATKLAVSL